MGLLIYRLPPLVSVLGTHLYQYTSWRCYEKLRSASADVLEDSFNTLVHFMVHDLWSHLPALCWVFISFWPEMAWPPCPTLPIQLITLSDLFLFPQMEKSPQRETFCPCERGETKPAEALKGIKTVEFKNNFEQWQKCLDGCIASKGEYSEDDWNLNM